MPRSNLQTSPPCADVPASPWGGVPWIGICLPLLMITAIIFFSPNFRLSQPETVRSDPLGGDFVQEWVGGYISGSAEQAERDRLYDLEFVKSVQHDAKVIGFSWPEEDYFPMVYPPFYYQSFQPFACLSYPLASKLWAIICGIAVSLTALLLFRFYQPSRDWINIGVSAALLFFPLITCLTMGQKSTLLLLILTGTFLLLHHNKPLASGVLFGLIAFKPHLGIVIGMTMLLKRQWRFAAGAILTVFLLVSVSWMFNPVVWTDYLKVVSGMNDYVESGGYQLAQSHSLWGAMQLTLSAVLGATSIKVVAGVIALGVLVLLWRIMRGTLEMSSKRFACQFSAMIFATVMLSPHFYTYDLTIVLLPILLITTTLPGVVGAESTSGIYVKIAGLLLAALFVLAGMFEQVALQTGFQFSIVLMIGVLVVLSLGLPELRSKANEAQAE